MAARGLDGKYGGQSGYWNDQDYFIGPRGHTEYWPRQKRYRGSEFSYGVAQATAYQYSSFTDREGNYHGGGGGYGGHAASYEGGYQDGAIMSSPSMSVPSSPQMAPTPADDAPERSVEELPEPMSGLKWSPTRTKVSQSSSSAPRQRAEPLMPAQPAVERAAYHNDRNATTLRIVR